MNEAHLHLIVNHFPIITPILALLVLSLGFALKSPVTVRIAYALLTLSAVFTFVSMATGEEAEHVVEQLNGSNHGLIHHHEEQAETFALIAYTLGILAAFALWSNWKNKPYAKYLAVAVGLIGLLALYFAQTTGTSGGQIRHTEIRAASDHIPPAAEPATHDD